MESQAMKRRSWSSFARAVKLPFVIHVTQHFMKVIPRYLMNASRMLGSAIESNRQITLQKRENIARIQGNCVNILGQIYSVKKDVQKFVDSMIAALEATKQEIFNDVEKKVNETLQLLATKQREMESQVAEIETAIERAEQILKRRTNAEITRLDTNTIFQGECSDGGQVECDFENLRHFVFIQNEMLMDRVNHRQTTLC